MDYWAKCFSEGYGCQFLDSEGQKCFTPYSKVYQINNTTMGKHHNHEKTHEGEPETHAHVLFLRYIFYGITGLRAAS